MDKTVYNAVMERANGRCELCGAHPPDLQLHHSFGGNGRRRQAESVETCFALCIVCHESAHNNRKCDLELKRKAQKRYREKGLDDEQIREKVGGKLY